MSEEVYNQIFNFLNNLSKNLEWIASSSVSRENKMKAEIGTEIASPLFSALLPIQQNISSLDNNKAKFLSNVKLIKEATCELELAFNESLKARKLKTD